MADSSKTAAEAEIDMEAPGAIYEIAKQRHAQEAVYETAAPTTVPPPSSGAGAAAGDVDVYSVATNAAGGDNGDPRNNDPRYSLMNKALASQGKVMDTQGGTYTAAMAVEQVIYQESDPSMYQTDRDSSKHRGTLRRTAEISAAWLPQKDLFSFFFFLLFLTIACNMIIMTCTDSKKKGNAILELSDTETKYIGVLKIITQIYFDSISANPKVFSEDDKKVLFANTFELLEIHMAFEKLLQRALVGDTTSGYDTRLAFFFFNNKIWGGVVLTNSQSLNGSLSSYYHCLLIYIRVNYGDS